MKFDEGMTMIFTKKQHAVYIKLKRRISRMERNAIKKYLEERDPINNLRKYNRFLMERENNG